MEKLEHQKAQKENASLLQYAKKDEPEQNENVK